MPRASHVHGPQPVLMGFHQLLVDCLWLVQPFSALQVPEASPCHFLPLRQTGTTNPYTSEAHTSMSCTHRIWWHFTGSKIFLLCVFRSWPFLWLLILHFPSSFTMCHLSKFMANLLFLSRSVKTSHNKLHIAFFSLGRHSSWRQYVNYRSWHCSFKWRLIRPNCLNGGGGVHSKTYATAKISAAY